MLTCSTDVDMYRSKVEKNTTKLLDCLRECSLIPTPPRTTYMLFNNAHKKNRKAQLIKILYIQARVEGKSGRYTYAMITSQNHILAYKSKRS